MVGHQKQWNFLVKSAKSGRLPHGFLFYGRDQLGKKTLAIEFAKFLIGNTDPPDFILIEPTAGKIQIVQIRELIKKLSFKPYLADFKIVIIDKAHLMNQEAQSCFLKFLEEPTDKTILILVTEYPEMLLPTILSRVQKIRFFPTKDSEIENNKEFISNLIKISESDLSVRFQYAKDIPAENLEEILDTWLRYFRTILISRLIREGTNNFNQYSLPKLKDIIRQIQSTKFLLSFTNVNPRLALEILLMKL